MRKKFAFVPIKYELAVREPLSGAAVADAETDRVPEPASITPCLEERVVSLKPETGAVEIGFVMGPTLNEMVWPASI